MLAGSRGGRDNAKRPRGWYSGREGGMSDILRFGDDSKVLVRGDFGLEAGDNNASFGAAVGILKGDEVESFSDGDLYVIRGFRRDDDVANSILVWR
jgi:hypothetical protein